MATGLLKRFAAYTLTKEGIHMIQPRFSKYPAFYGTLIAFIQKFCWFIVVLFLVLSLYNKIPAIDFIRNLGISIAWVFVHYMVIALLQIAASVIDLRNLSANTHHTQITERRVNAYTRKKP